MYRHLNLSLVFILSGLMMLSQGCTSNPVGGNDISTGQRQLLGRVELESWHSPDGVYVWLEAFNLGVFSREDGSFTLGLPSSSSDVNGVFHVYFFVANYQLDSVEVAIRDGQFIYGEGALNTSGELREIVRLKQFLAISADVSPKTVTRVNNINVTMTFSLSMRSLSGTSRVVLPNTTPGFLSSVFFQNVETKELFIFQGQRVTTEEAITVGQTPITREMNVTFTRINLPSGNYLFVPYILVSHDEIPEDLINSIALNAFAFGPNYLKLPLKRDGGDFEIRE